MRARPDGAAPGEAESALAALRACAALRDLDRGVLEELARACAAVRYRRRQLLYALGSPADEVYVIERGRVRLLCSRGDDGHLTLGYRGPGDLVGERALAHAGVHAEDAIAIEPLQAWRIPLAHVRRLAAEHVGFVGTLCGNLAAELTALQRRLAVLTGRTVECRVAAFLAEQARGYGVPHPGGVALGDKLTHQEIADYVASTRETVTLTLGALRRKGLVAFEGRRLVVVDRAALERLA